MTQRVKDGQHSTTATHEPSSLIVNESSGPAISRSGVSERLQVEDTLRPISTLIRDAIRLQEKTSVLRTREGQESKKFEESRRRLKASTGRFLDATLGAFAELEKLRENKAHRRDEPYAQTKSQPRQFFAALEPELWSDESVTAYSSGAQEDFRHNAIISELQIMREDFEEDHDVLQKQEEIMAATRNKFLDLEYRLQIKQTQLKEALDHAMDAFPQLQAPFSIQASTVKASPQTSFEGSQTASSQSETPSLVRDYRKCKGRIGILNERLGEQDHYFEEGRGLRELLLDRNEVPDTTDDEFYEDYRSRRKETEDELDECNRRLEYLKHRCAELGFTTTPASRQSSPKSPTTRSLASAHEGENEYGLDSSLSHEPLPRPLIQPMTSIEMQEELAADPQANIRIESWLESVTTPAFPAQCSPPDGADVQVADQTSSMGAAKGFSTKAVKLLRRRTFPASNASQLRTAETVQASTAAFDISRDAQPPTERPLADTRPP